jgi:hypothetical protein
LEDKMAISVKGVVVGAEDPTDKGCIIHVFVEDRARMLEIHRALSGRKVKGGPLEPKFSRVVQGKTVTLEFE